MKSRIASQKGFSLIELMMVVVIIGVLAGVGIPQYQKFQMKARQSEVKSLLSGMYTAQKAFYAEWNQYYADYRAVGYGLSGALGYKTVFNTAGVVGPANHPSVTYRAAAAVQFNSSLYCAAQTNGNTALGDCNDLGANAAANNTVPGAVVTANTFDFGGIANLDDDVTMDSWSLDENKRFNQISDDISN